MTVLLGVFRRPEMLMALLCERTESAQAGALFSEHLVPLASVPEALCPWRDADIRAWRSLQKVPNMSPRAVKAIVRSLLSTVALPGVGESEGTEADATLRFEGGALDLRPLLCTPSGEERVLAELSDAIAAHRESSELPEWHWTHRHEIAALPTGFRRHLLWGLSLAPWSHVELMLAVYQTLELASQPELSLAVGYLSVRAPLETILWWCDALVTAPSEIRVEAASAMAGSRALASRPNADVTSALASGDLAAARALLATAE